MSETPAEDTPIYDQTAATETMDYAKPFDGIPTDEHSTSNEGLDVENFTKDSPYDASGMPIGTTYADYDNYADVAQKMVTTRPVTYPPVAEPFEEAKLETEAAITKEGWNGALEANVNSAYPLESDAKDLSDTGESRKLVQQENTDGTTTILDTPILLNQGDLNAEKEKLDPDFLKVIEENTDAHQ